MNAVELAEEHFPLVDVCVRRFLIGRPSHVDADALRGAALEALVRYARRFDASRGVPFEGYAWAGMWWAMTDELRATDGHTRGERARGETADGMPLQGSPDSLDRPHGFLEDCTLLDLLSQGDFSDVACRRLDLLVALRALPKRQQEIALAGMVGISQFELAEHFGITQGRVSQISRKTLRRLAA